MDSTFAERLEAWQRQFGRNTLPWQSTKDPYARWVSEIMLQQTQVETVRAYYLRFIERFPTVSDLAAAPKMEVMKLWEGLGYYRRAENLHRAAREVMVRFGGRMPKDATDLLTLPGIGDYTANAVAAFCGGRLLKAPVDGNVRRVLSRCFCEESFLALPPKPRRVDEIAAAAMSDASDAGVFTQAVFDLGALVCRPKTPKCDACPLLQTCRAKAWGVEARVPLTVRPAKGSRIYIVPVDLFEAETKLKETEGGLWSGLWAPSGMHQSGEAVEEPSGGFRRVGLPPLKHLLTHLEVTFVPFVREFDSREAFEKLPGEVFPLDALPPLSVPVRKIYDALAERIR